MKKKDYDYFQAFTQAVDYSCQAAEILKNTLTYFDTDKLNDRLKDVHGVEHAADLGKHEMMSELARAFITPIEREDILELMQELDDVTDDIEDVLIRTYIFHILSIREDALRFADIISRCCGEMLKMMKEFRDFRKSKTIHEMIVTINDLEEEGDRLYTEAVRRLFMHSKDPIELMVWREIFDRMEKCCDACEHVANIVESIIMKNS
jgi:hypothetical protein